MAGIWNINSIYNSNLRRVSSKLTFEVNETFKGRIISKDDEKGEVLIKTLDGWQFPASIEKPLDFPADGLFRFQVTGFENGKLKLRLVGENERSSSGEEGSIENILLQNHIELDEHSILEKMVKFGMPLTKENISKVKNLVDFMQKLVENPQEEEAFISKYLQSKNIGDTSIKGKAVTEALKNFFSELKTLDVNDVLTLIENNVDLNADNIKSYKKVFKEDLGLYKGIEDVKNVLEDSIQKKIVPAEKDTPDILAAIDTELGAEEEQLDNDLGIKPKELEIQQENKSSRAETSLSGVVKDTIKEYTGRQLEIRSKLSNELSALENEYKALEDEIEKLSITLESKEIDKGISGELKEALKNNFKTLKSIIEGVIGKKVILDDADLIDISNRVEDRIASAEMKFLKAENHETSLDSVEQEFKQEFGKVSLNTENLKTKVSGLYGNNTSSTTGVKGISVLDVLKNIAAQENSVKDTLLDIIDNRIKASSGNEYDGIVDKLERMTEKNILDVFNNEAGKEAASTEFKQGMEKLGLPSNKEEVKEAVNKLTGKNIELTDVEFEELQKVIESKLEKTAEGRIGNNIENLRLGEKGITDLIREQIATKTNEIKNVVRELVTSGNELKPDALTKVMDMIKNSINDIKVFNSVSNQYYYMDLPVKLRNNDYPCKLIIKDDRRKGKKIDSKNVKLVVSVSTVNMGKIDGYIKVQDNNMNVTLRCGNNWVKVLDMGKEKLVKNLTALGYNLHVSVDKREEEATLANCREFFDDSSFGNINVKV